MFHECLCEREVSARTRLSRESKLGEVVGRFMKSTSPDLPESMRSTFASLIRSNGWKMRSFNVN